MPEADDLTLLRRARSGEREAFREIVVRYEAGEKAKLVQKLRSCLEKGPIIIWTPYAAAMRVGQPWRHVRSVDPSTDAVGFRIRGRSDNHDAAHAA